MQKFCEVLTGRKFYADENDIFKAEKELQKQLKINDEITFNEWLDILHFEKVKWGDKYRWCNLGCTINEEKTIYILFQKEQDYTVITYSWLPSSRI